MIFDASCRDAWGVFSFNERKKGSYFFVAKKVSKAKARFQRKPTPFSRVSWLVKTMNIRKVKYSKFKGVKLPLLKIIGFKKRNIYRKKLDFQILMKMFFVNFFTKKL